jgi:lipid II:glycine glycyltransferase (peptidoglycan interpeptide bridge formation enzyme)
MGQEPTTRSDAGWSGWVRTSRTDEDPAWDDFLASHDHGHHTQTALWSRVKASLGWSVTRVVAKRNEVIDGGAQILHRPLRGLGRAGYVSMGPVLPAPDPELSQALMSAIEQAMRDERIRLLAVQPPVGWARPTPSTRGHDDIPGIGDVAPRATVLVDVSRSLDDILASMKARTRYNARVGARKGLVVREGGFDDIPAFHRLLCATAARRGFSPFPESYYEEMWRVFAPNGHIRLTFAECDGQASAAQLAIAFGESVINKMSVWRGREGARRPNEALQWDTITWAKANGKRFYDLEGIRVEAARALLAGEPLPDRFKDTVTSFKLGFGGDVVVRPEPSVLIPNPVLDVAVRRLYPRLRRNPWVKDLMRRVRVGPAAASPSGRSAAA